MLKALENIESTIQPEKIKIEVDGDNRARRDGKCKFDRNKIDGGKSRDDKVGKKSQKKSKSKYLSKSKKMVGSLDFFTFRAKLVFI